MEDFKELVFFAAELIFAAFIITAFVILRTTIIGEAADIRNSQLLARQQVRSAAQTMMYDNSTVNGIDVLAAFKENSVDGKLTITLKNRSGNVILTMDSGNYKNAQFKLASLKGKITENGLYSATVGDNSISFRQK